jgi:putative thioredoxin
MMATVTGMRALRSYHAARRRRTRRLASIGSILHVSGMPTAASASPVSIDVTEATFERDVLERSTTTPVVVDFWAPWCAPCRALGPLLERLAEEHRGEFVLAKLNVDEAPQLSAAFGIRGIPAVKGFRDGTIVSEFTGAQPEPVVRQFLEAVLPTEADRLVAAAQGAADAEPTLRRALELEPRHPRALVALAHLLAARGETTEALALLERVSPASPLLDEAERLAAELRTRADGAGEDVGALRAAVAADPDDLQARLDLGRALVARREYEEGLGQLLAVVQRDRRFADEGARKAMIDVFQVLGGDHPLVDRFRAELAKTLYA